MRRLLVLGLFALVACSGSDSPDNAPEWLRVLNRKKAAVAPKATARERQMYADSVAAFTKKYPAHGRAREVYQRIELEFARELASLGRYQDSIRFYRAVLNSDPTNAAALRGVADAFDHLAISRPKLLASIACPGGQGDVSVHGHLLFMSVEQTRGRIDCGTGGVQETVSAERFRGIRIFDITDLSKPKQIAAIQTNDWSVKLIEAGRGADGLAWAK